jgi:hypothetical protein
MLTKKRLLVFWFLLVFQAIFLLGFVFLRYVDADEGLYLETANLVKNGKLPYLDFFYNQMPYLPFAYSLISGFGFSSLFLGRLISASASLLLGLLLFWFTYKSTRDAEIALLVFFLYGFHGLTLTWHSTVKTSTFSDLWGFISSIFFISYLSALGQKTKNLTLFFSGIFIGLALNFRLTHMILFVTTSLLIFLLPPLENIRKRMLSFVFLLWGAILSSSFAIYLFLKDPHIFIFDNLIFRQIWGFEIIKMNVLTRLFTFSKFLFYPQDLIILILTIFSLVYLVRRWIKEHKTSLEDRTVIVFLSFAFSIIILSFFISPTQFQYFAQSLPFLLIACVPALRKWKSKWENKRIIVPMGTLYLVCLIPFVLIFIFAIREKNRQFTIKDLKRVVAVIQKNSQPEERILSFMPLYSVLSQREPMPGLEAWGGEVAPLLTKKQMKDCKLIDLNEVKEMIHEARVNLIVAEEWILPGSDSMNPNSDSSLWVKYQLLEKIHGVQIYKKK